ncbi:uncharacterized protein PHALS_14778 [Plasmopara halstedii]|uniref:Uncharacterized protein n=1 Tax=Plasmopara halstedii TaxID=4781 RepID=A0A0N7L6F5_PLAHL|nr:uncharacterized protein PHALS_14778 [Plasmopara halstedii]CEG44131.1 hypothetical protein PHALS_14778 [Plasmopara halstedii]|eukprot:XP_024580500.1 hypothetical protein PHALS_14778 [Plasmopara halstedii]
MRTGSRDKTCLFYKFPKNKESTVCIDISLQLRQLLTNFLYEEVHSFSMAIVRSMESIHTTVERSHYTLVTHKSPSSKASFALFLFSSFFLDIPRKKRKKCKGTANANFLLNPASD